jgi:hypothetical protein
MVEVEMLAELPVELSVYVFYTVWFVDTETGTCFNLKFDNVSLGVAPKLMMI